MTKKKKEDIAKIRAENMKRWTPEDRKMYTDFFEGLEKDLLKKKKAKEKNASTPTPTAKAGKPRKRAAEKQDDVPQSIDHDALRAMLDRISNPESKLVDSTAVLNKAKGAAKKAAGKKKQDRKNESAEEDENYFQDRGQI